MTLSAISRPRLMHCRIGDAGRMVSLDHFGASADYDTIFRQFHITAEAVTLAAEESLRSLGATTR